MDPSLFLIIDIYPVTLSLCTTYWYSFFLSFFFFYIPLLSYNYVQVLLTVHTSVPRVGVSDKVYAVK